MNQRISTTSNSNALASFWTCPNRNWNTKLPAHHPCSVRVSICFQKSIKRFLRKCVTGIQRSVLRVKFFKIMFVRLRKQMPMKRTKCKLSRFWFCFTLESRSNFNCLFHLFVIRMKITKLFCRNRSSAEMLPPFTLQSQTAQHPNQ